MPKLLIKQGPGKGDVFEFSQEKVTLGRDSGNALRLADRTVSRFHARIVEVDGAHYVSDLDSHNGTLVNGERIKRRALFHMDEICLGNVVLIFLEDAATDFSQLIDPQGSEPEVTQTIVLDEPPALKEVASQRLIAITELSQAATTVKSLPRLFDLLIDSILRTLEPDRVVPIVVQDDGALLPYVRAKSGFERGLEDIGISKSAVEHSLKKGIAVLSQGSVDVSRKAAARGNRARVTSVLCAPLKVGRKVRGMIYCDRVDRPDLYQRADLQYLCSLAAQTAVAMESIRDYERMAARARGLEGELAGQYDLMGQSPQIRRIFEFIRKAAPTNASVLVCGESGTGKELVAGSIHYNGPRREGPFEAVNCAAISPALVESELFGHVKGAFTGAIADRPGRFELAHQGTIFLDEVGTLPLECQTKLLRVLETGTIRRVGDVKDRNAEVRVIAATNQNLEALKDSGRFREDLYYRLNVLRTDLPPLRERGDDIKLLAEHFLRISSAECGRAIKGFAPEVMEAFCRYGWPGNVRELKNIIERMVIMCEEEEVLGAELLPAELRVAPSEAASGPLLPERTQDVQSLDEVEKRYILSILQATGGNKKRAAKILGVDRSTLYAKLKRYGVET